MKQVFYGLLFATMLCCALPSAAYSIGAYAGPGTGTITKTVTGTQGVVTLTGDYTINSGVTISGSGNYIIIYATGTIDIQGSLTINGITGAAAIGATGTAGTGAGGIGATTSTGAIGGTGGTGADGTIPQTFSIWAATSWSSTITLRGSGGGGGGTGVAGVSAFGGGGGGGGPCANGGNGGNAGVVAVNAGIGGTGGRGGGAIYLVAPRIIIGASAVISADGTNGNDATGVTPNGSSGGGGGSGGNVIFITRNLDERAGSIVRANGGNGGLGGGSGGSGAAGGAGGTTGCNGGSNGATPTTGGGGGGGGAGGMVIRHVDTDNIWRGTWNSATAYGLGDVVYYQNSAYVSKTANTNMPPNTNPDDWDLVATTGFTSLVTTASEPTGVNCAWAGLKVQWGLDNGDGGGTANNGILEAGEIDGTSYVCNGADGFSALAVTSAEPSGVNCAEGGVQIDAGLDNGDGGGTARDGVLQVGEIDSTGYACRGPPGLEWRGNWDGAAAYVKHDGVYYGGNTYIAIQPNTNMRPDLSPDDWDLFAGSDDLNLVAATVFDWEAFSIKYVPVLIAIALVVAFFNRRDPFFGIIGIAALLYSTFAYPWEPVIKTLLVALMLYIVIAMVLLKRAGGLKVA